MGFHSLLTGTIEGDIEQNVGPFTYGLGQMSGQLDAFNKSMSDMRAKSTLTQPESNEALSLLSQGLLGNTNINQKTIAPKIAEWQRTSDNFYQNQRDVAAKATADAQAKATADAQAQAASKAKAFSDFDEIGQEDVNKVYSNIATPQPEPSVAFIANNYNTPSLFGNVQAAEENVGEITAGTVAAKAVKEAGNWWNKGKDSPSNLKSLGGKEANAKVFGNKGLLQNDLRQLTRTDASFKAGDKGLKGLRPAKALTPEMLKTGPSPFVRQAVARAFSRVPVLAALMPGTAGLTQAQEMASIGKNPDGSPIAGWQNPYGLSQFMNNNPYNNQKNLFGMRRDRGLEETVAKEGRDYRRGKREERAEEVRAKAQAVADAKAKVEAEQARQTEKEKQRMVDNKSFSDTDSGSFDEGGNYSDWGSKEEYDDDFGADSTWGDDGGDSGGSSGGGGGGGSYIATATTQALGEEGLTVFNNWRDHMRNVVPEFTVSFGRYRVTAPKIVTAIDKKDNSKAIYKDIWDKHLKPIYDLIVADKDSVKAQDDYRVMVRELSNKHLKDK